MARYIDADLFKENTNPVWFFDNGYCGLYDKKDIENMIDAQPTADVQEVKHGHWTKPEDEHTIYIGYKCSVCGSVNTQKFPYCSWCGAKMDEEADK